MNTATNLSPTEIGEVFDELWEGIRSRDLTNIDSHTLVELINDLTHSRLVIIQVVNRLKDELEERERMEM